MKFHHIGLAVPAPQAAFRYLEALVYTVGNEVFDLGQKVNLTKRGTVPDRHICYVVADPDAEVALIETSVGWTWCPPKPAPLFGGREVSFHNVEDFGLIELLRATPD